MSWIRWAMFLLVVAALLGCDGGSGGPDGDGDGDTDADGDGDGDGDGGGDAGGPPRVVILHTSDEHGALTPYDDGDSGATWGGVVNVLGWWTDVEGLDPDTHLIVSSGDNWTGGAVSTWFEGAPMVAAMSTMGYEASALGNHELDFGQDVLEARASEASFPYLAANVVESSTGEPPSFVEPFIVVQVGEVSVGLVGIALPETPWVAHGAHVAGLEFGDPREALEVAVPEVRDAGAEAVVVLAHVPSGSLAGVARGLSVHVDAFFGGHGHQVEDFEVDGVPVVESGAHFSGYSRVELALDEEGGAVVSADVEWVAVSYPTSEASPVGQDPELAALVDDWSSRADDLLGEVVGYTTEGLSNGSWPLANWIADSWRWAVPYADVALTNSGGIRAGLGPGEFSRGDVVAMLPFDNEIIEVELTGAELLSQMDQALDLCATAGCYLAISGARYRYVDGDAEITLADGAVLDPEAAYTVLVNDFMYYGGAGFTLEGVAPDAPSTGLSYREPVLMWCADGELSESNPLEDHLDPEPRGE